MISILTPFCITKVEHVGIKPLQIKVRTNERGEAKALVKIEPVTQEKIEESMLPLRIHGCKMEAPQVNLTTPSIFRVEF